MLSLDRCPQEDESTTFAELLVDPKPTPEQTAEQRQLRKIVAHLAGGLPRSQQTALILRVQNGFSLKETAEMLGVPLGTVKAQLARGRARIIERFHKVTRTPKIEASGSSPKARRKASSGCRQNHAQDTDYLPIPAVLTQGGACELCVSV
jgi:cytochrome P450